MLDSLLLLAVSSTVSTPSYLRKIKLHDTNRVSAHPHEADAALHLFNNAIISLQRSLCLSMCKLA